MYTSVWLCVCVCCFSMCLCMYAYTFMYESEHKARKKKSTLDWISLTHTPHTLGSSVTAACIGHGACVCVSMRFFYVSLRLYTETIKLNESNNSNKTSAKKHFYKIYTQYWEIVLPVFTQSLIQQWCDSKSHRVYIQFPRCLLVGFDGWLVGRCCCYSLFFLCLPSKT